MVSTYQKYLSSIFKKIVFLTLILTLSVSAILLGIHKEAQSTSLKKEFQKNSLATGNAVVALIQTALDLQIPFQDMVGAQEYLETNLKPKDGLEYIAITTTDGTLRYHTNSVPPLFSQEIKKVDFGSLDSKKLFHSLSMKSYENLFIPITTKEKIVGYLHLGVANSAVERHVNDVFYDILVILIVSLVIGFEAMNFFFKNTLILPVQEFLRYCELLIEGNFQFCLKGAPSIVLEPIKQSINKLVTLINQKFYEITQNLKKNVKSKNTSLQLQKTFKDIIKGLSFAENETLKPHITKTIISNLRLPAFGVVFCETVLVPIIPSYAVKFYSPSLPFDIKFLSSLPIVVFMIFSMIGIFCSMKLESKKGFYYVFRMGTLLSAIGYFLGFTLVSLWGLIISRIFVALGYGISFAGIQNYIALYSPPKERIVSYSVFTVAFAAAYICGAPIGGILSQNLGYSVCFLASGITALITMLLFHYYIPQAKAVHSQTSGLSFKTPLSELKPWGLLSSIFFSGLPTRLVFSSFFLFIYPLYLQNLGNSQSAIGRIIMLFGVVSFLLAPFTPGLVKKFPAPRLVVTFSMALICTAVFTNSYMENTSGAIIGIVIYALGYTLHITSNMSVLALETEQLKDPHAQKVALNLYFIIERIGMILGPAVISQILSRYGYENTLEIIGTFLSISVVLYTLVYIFLAISTPKESGAKNE